MITLFFVTLFRSFNNNDNEMDNEGDDKDRMNKWTGKFNVSLIYKHYILGIN